MAGKRVPVILALVAILAVGLLLMFFSQEGDRAGRRGASDGRGAGTGVDPATGASAEDKAAYEARLKEILEKYGARNGTGAVYLTKPKAPGVGLRVTVRAEIDGFRLEAEAYADKAGGFSFASLPGVDGYSLLAISRYSAIVSFPTAVRSAGLSRRRTRTWPCSPETVRIAV